jgi:hypothetical protein
MSADNLFAYTQAYTRTVLFSRKKRNKDTLAHIRQDAFPIIGHGDLRMLEII